MDAPAYNWFEAEALAVLGWAIRREGWRKWLVYRHHGWYVVEWVDGAEIWRVPLAGDVTTADYLAKDFTTAPWEDAARPACSLPGVPAPPLAGGSFGAPSDCGLPVIQGDEGIGGIVPLGGPVPVLEYLVITASLNTSYPPPGVSVNSNGFVTVPAGYLGGVQVEAKFKRDGQFPGGGYRSINPVKCYCWVRVGAAVPTTGMVEPYLFALDQVSSLPGAFGPVLADRLSRDQTSEQVFLPPSQRDHSITDIYQAGTREPLVPLLSRGTPAGAFAAIPMQPEQVIHVRLDTYMPDGSSHSFTGSLALGPWAVQPVVMTVTPTLDPPAGSQRIGYGGDGIPYEEYEVPPPVDDDVYAVCYPSAPSQIGLSVSVAVTGGKAGSAAVFTLTIDDVVQETSVDGGYVNTAPVTVTPGSEHTWSATWTQEADAFGPEVTHTESGSITVPSLCP